MSLLKKATADLYLVVWRAMVVHPLRRLFDFDRRSPRERFLDNFASEGLVPTSDEDFAALQGASRCIHCGLCDFTDPAHEAARWRSASPSLLSVAASRNSVLAPAAAAAVLPSEAALVRGEAICPTSVPIRTVAELVRRKGAEVARVAR